MGKAEWGGNPVCWWLCLYLCFVCCLDEVSCTGCLWWLDDAGSCIQVVSFEWVLTIWYSLGLILWQSRVLESALLLQRLRCDLKSGTKNLQVVCYGIKWDENKYPKGRYQRWTTDKWQLQIRQIIIKIMEYMCVCVYIHTFHYFVYIFCVYIYTYTHTHKQNQNSPTKIK